MKFWKNRACLHVTPILFIALGAITIYRSPEGAISPLHAIKESINVRRVRYNLRIISATAKLMKEKDTKALQTYRSETQAKSSPVPCFHSSVNYPQITVTCMPIRPGASKQVTVLWPNRRGQADHFKNQRWSVTALQSPESPPERRRNGNVNFHARREEEEVNRSLFQMCHHSHENPRAELNLYCVAEVDSNLWEMASTWDVALLINTSERWVLNDL